MKLSSSNSSNSSSPKQDFKGNYKKNFLFKKFIGPKGKPVIRIKNFHRLRDNSIRRVNNFKETLQDKTKSASEIKESIKVQVNDYFKDIKKDIEFYKDKINKGIENTNWSKLLKILPYIFIGLVVIATYEPLLLTIFIKAVSISVSSTTGFSITSISIFLMNIKKIFMGLDSLEKALSVIGFFHILLDEVPEWFNSSHFENMSKNSFLSLLYTSLKRLTNFKSTLKTKLNAM